MMKTMKFLMILTVPMLGLTSGEALGQTSGICEGRELVTTDAPEVTIMVQGSEYSPRCLVVKPGTLVTIQASSHHPLQGIANGSGPENPFALGGESISPETHRLGAPGIYAYFCTRHGNNRGNGMAGLIVVQE